MAASQTGPARCSRAQAVCAYQSKDSIKSISAGDRISGRVAGVLTRRSAYGGASGGRAPSKGKAGEAASVLCWIVTVGTGSIEGAGDACEGEALRGGRRFRALGAGRGVVGGVGSERSKPYSTAA